MRERNTPQFWWERLAGSAPQGHIGRSYLCEPYMLGHPSRDQLITSCQESCSIGKETNSAIHGVCDTGVTYISDICRSG
jgi:hypothetical protein